MLAPPLDPDALLMLRVREGDDEAFTTLVRAYQRPMLNLAYRYLGNRDEAEDAAQEVFVRVYQAARRYIPRAKFKTWLYRIAINLCLDMKAKSRPVPERDLTTGEAPSPLAQAADGSPSPLARAEQAELARTIHRALGQLNERERLAVILASFEDASLDDIAQALGIPVGAVKSLLHRATHKLAVLLAPERPT